MIRESVRLNPLQVLLKKSQKADTQREFWNAEDSSGLEKHGRSQSVEKILLKRRVPSLEYFEKTLMNSSHVPSKSQVSFKNLPLRQMLGKSGGFKPNIEIMVAFNQIIKKGKVENCENFLEKIRMVMRLFEMIVHEEKKYKNELKVVLEEVKKAIFMNKRDVCTEILDQVLDNNFAVLKDITEDVPYFYIYDIAIKANEEKIKEIEKLKSDENVLNGKLKNNAEMQENTIKKLEKEIAKLQNNMEKSGIEAKEYVSERINLENQLSKAVFKITDLNSMLESQDTIINDHNKVKGELQMRLKALQNLSDENESKNKALGKKNKEMKMQYNNLADSYKQLLAKLKMAYRENQDFEHLITNLEKQNSELYIRAAAGFEELTPRPDLTKIFEEIECEVIKGSTQEKVQNLHISIKKYKEKISESQHKKKGRVTPNLKPRRRPSVLSVGEEVRKFGLDSSRISNNNSAM